MFTFVSFVIFFDYLTQWSKILFIYILLIVWDQNHLLLSFLKTPSIYKSKLSLSKLRLENANKFLNKSGKILGNDEIKFFYTVDRNYLPSSLCLITLLGRLHFFLQCIAINQKPEFGHKLFYFKKYFIYFHGHKN